MWRNQNNHKMKRELQILTHKGIINGQPTFRQAASVPVKKLNYYR
jgi:hypothetical protein